MSILLCYSYIILSTHDQACTSYNARARAAKRRVLRINPSRTSSALTSLAGLSLSFGSMLVAYYYVSKIKSCVEEIRSVDDV